MRSLWFVMLLIGCGPKVAQTGPERTGIVHRGDLPLTLVGPAIGVGAKAPVANLRDNVNKPASVDFADGITRVLMFVPSLDTPTCSIQTRTFNYDASDLGPAVEVVLVSRDLPFAQARFCGAEGIDRVRTLSDFIDGAYGRSWGLYVKETDLLGRAVAVIDKTGTVTYLQVVENLPDEPNYEAALTALHALVPLPPKPAAPPE